MRALLKLFLGLLLAAGLMTGSVAHALETAGGHEVTSATQWLHSAGDHDEVPADNHKDYPHHHNQCHGHDLAAHLKIVGPAMPERLDFSTKPALAAALATERPARLLRPPIA